MTPSLKKLISNQLIVDKTLKKYSLIIGQNPSKGARSPTLWNSTFKKYGISCKMYPADVKKKNFKKFIKLLVKDKNFLAAAITNPYKEEIYEIFKNKSSKLAKKIKSGNCLFKKKNFFYLTNTDAEASFVALDNRFKIKKKNSILILGYGGVGKAVCSAFDLYSYKSTKIYIATRKNRHKSKNSKLTFINWENINDFIDKINICINCTTLGFQKIKQSPLNINQIKKLSKNTILYDVIYNPVETNFLKLGKQMKLKTLNGVDMNLLQAVIAFNLSNDIKDKKKTTRIMKKVLF